MTVSWPPFVLDGQINGDAVTARVGQCLVPTLAPGDIIIADNLARNKGMPASQLIQNTGPHLSFLPPYSPDLNPIEIVFGKLKTLLQKADWLSPVWRSGSLALRRSPNDLRSSRGIP